MKAQGLLKGQPVSLHVLDYGLFRVHSGPRVIGLCGYLITTDAAERILVDSGMPAKYADDAVAAGQEDGLDSFGHVVSLTPDNLPGAQLARCGVSLTDITHIIQTHTHIDHIGGLDLCPHAPMIIAAAERALPKPLYWTGGQPMEWPKRAFVELDKDTTLGPGIELLLCPGHTPGQLAIAMTLPETGAVLLTSDAISRPEDVVEGFAGSWDAAQAQHHGTRLLARAEDTQAFVIYGHCPDQWSTLRKAPDCYR